VAMYKILEKRALTPVTKLYLVEAPLVAEKAQPGQFVIVRIASEGERIPLTIAGFDRQAGTVTIIVQEVGMTTTMMDRLEAGDELHDLVGPLGRPAELLDEGWVVTVGGGFGVAPVLPIAEALKERGVHVTSIIGARTKDLVILEDEMRAVSNKLYVCTDDGSYGEPGFVTTVLERLINQGEAIDQVIAIGPMPMMRAVAEVTRPHGLKTYVSVDPIMVDGTGMCGACRVKIGDETKFACVDGPIFDAHEIDYDLALKRVKAFAAQESEAMDWYKGRGCRCGGS